MKTALAAVSSFFLVIAVLVPGAAQARQGALPDFTGMVESNGPAVVNIGTTRSVSNGPAFPPGLDGPERELFEEFLRRFFGEGAPGGEAPEQFDSTSLGSGFIISRDGFIITNHHVVAEADEIVVKLNDRRELKAELIGSDPRSDIALLKVEADNLPVLRLGSAQDLKVGEWVLAIGSPFGFDHSVTAGIVSAKGRSLPTENYVPFIQTDVAINPGNSGGPLFNLDGEVVGINSQIYSRTGGFMGLSFAIPIEVAMNVVEQLKDKGFVARGWLGVYIQEVTQELAESFEMDRPTGALVARVMDDSPAAKGGIRVGDVILEFDGKPVRTSAGLPPLVGATEVGRRVPVRVNRDGREITLRVVLGQLPEEEAMAEAGPQAAPDADQSALGLTVAEPGAELREALGIASGGVVVREVGEGPARDAGLVPGDVITMVDGQNIESVRQFTRLVESLPEGKSVAVLVQREQGPQFLALRVPR
jgi:serine protease Do